MQAEVRCARFKGVKPIEFIDMNVIGGDLFTQVNDTEKFALRNIRKAAWIEDEKIERQERWEYPPDAIRGAIVNAVCHRDYESTANIQMRVFDDRMEILNPGLLPRPLTPDDLKGKHESIPRNPLIAKCFFLAGFIEQWGSGTNKIMEWCVNHNLPEPVFEETARSFVLTLRKYSVSEEFISELNDRQRAIIEYLNEHSEINRGRCMELLNVSKNTALRELEELLKKGAVKRKGKGRNVYYTLL